MGETLTLCADAGRRGPAGAERESKRRAAGAGGSVSCEKRRFLRAGKSCGGETREMWTDLTVFCCLMPVLAHRIDCATIGLFQNYSFTNFNVWDGRRMEEER